MSAAQRRKGAAAEREVAEMFRSELGVECERELAQTRDGGVDLIPKGTGLAVEVKRQERANLYPWLEQVAEGAPDGLLPCVVWRQSRRGWVVAMDWDYFVQLVREAMPGTVDSLGIVDNLDDAA